MKRNAYVIAFYNCNPTSYEKHKSNPQNSSPISKPLRSNAG